MVYRYWEHDGTQAETARSGEVENAKKDSKDDSPGHECNEKKIWTNANDYYGYDYYDEDDTNYVNGANFFFYSIVCTS